MTPFSPILLLGLIIVLLIGLAIRLWCFTEKNLLQKTLVGIILLWTLMFLGLIVNLIRVYNGVQSPVSGVMNFHAIWMGLIGLFSLVSYPAVALHQRNIRLSKSLSWLSPVLLSLVVYIVWHLATGTDMNYRYLTIGELWDNRFTVPVILRALMILFFITYLVLILVNIWRLIPIYQRYSDDNYADTAHNVEWLRLVITAIGSICTAYLVILIWKHPIGEMIYAVVTGAFFIMLSVNALSHKLFTESAYVTVDWSFGNGWRLIEKQREIELEIDAAILEIELRFNEWINIEKPYTDSDFTAEAVYGVFPELRYPVLTILLARRGHTFKSYVRELRIIEACRLLEDDPNSLCKQIALRVGFSSSQVLSRSFVMVTGKTPGDFRKKEVSTHVVEV